MGHASVSASGFTQEAVFANCIRAPQMPPRGDRVVPLRVRVRQSPWAGVTSKHEVLATQKHWPTH